MTRPNEGQGVSPGEETAASIPGKVEQLGCLILSQLRLALAALKYDPETDVKPAIALTDAVIRAEQDIDAALLTALAGGSTAAEDFRDIVTCLKAVADLGRIGEESAQFAQFAQNLGEERASIAASPLMRDLHRIGQIALGCLEQALTDFHCVELDREPPKTTDRREFDDVFHASLRHILTYLMEDARHFGDAVSVVLLARSLERIVDHALHIHRLALLRRASIGNGALPDSKDPASDFLSSALSGDPSSAT